MSGIEKRIEILRLFQKKEGQFLTEINELWSGLPSDQQKKEPKKDKIDFPSDLKGLRNLSEK